MIHFIRTLIIIATVFLLFSCSDGKLKEGRSQTITPVHKDSIILTLTRQVLISIKAKDYKKLADLIHPTLGVRFSPYAYIDTTTNLFSRKRLLQEFNTQNKLYWGEHDGSGDTILLTVDSYFSQFVYNADFLNAEKTSLNKMIGGGNSLNNLESVYKGCDFTESYFSGFDKKYEGMDWCCLRLVFKKYLDKFYLIAIVHDQWTT